jgi:hypothetical protein
LPTNWCLHASHAPFPSREKSKQSPRNAIGESHIRWQDVLCSPSLFVVLDDILRTGFRVLKGCRGRNKHIIRCSTMVKSQWKKISAQKLVRKQGEKKTNEMSVDHLGEDSLRISQVHAPLARSTDRENEQLYNEWKESPMKHLSLRHVLSLALCLCLAITLLTAFSPTRSAHAATASTCQTRHYAPGNLLVYAGDGTSNRVQWTTCKGNTMDLNVQVDGNLVLYLNGQPIWATNTTSFNVNGDWLRFQSDSNLVLYNQFFNVMSGESVFPAWSSKTKGQNATSFELQSDGNMVIYSASGPIWDSGTSGH